MRRAVAVAVAVVAATGLTVVVAPAAQAHVGVDSTSTEPGAYTVLTFRVPTESDTASTVRVTVHLPTATPFASVRTQPTPGWTAEVTTSDLPTPVTDDDGNEISAAPSQVTWTATGAGIGPGEFDELSLSVGPLPESGTVFLPVVQEYSDGTEVDWVQQAQGDAEPEHPAPSVVVGSAAAGPDASEPVATAAGAESAGASGTWALGLAVAALVVALAAGVLALGALGAFGALGALGALRRGWPRGPREPEHPHGTTAELPAPEATDVAAGVPVDA